VYRTYSSQSTANSSDISVVGRPSAESTSSMVMRAALGMDAAPILASVAVKLNKPTPYCYLIFVVPCIMLNSEVNPKRCNNCVYSSQWLYSTENR